MATKNILFLFGAAGAGKTTFATNFKEKQSRMAVTLVNLDPVVRDRGQFDFDICDYVSVEDVMDEFDYGPNGGLFESLRYLEEIFFPDETVDDESVPFLQPDSITIFDCPGQIELFLHSSIIPNFIKRFSSREDCSIAICYLTDGTTISSLNKFRFNLLIALVSTNRFVFPMLNLITKTDLMDRSQRSVVWDETGSCVSVELDSEGSQFDRRLNEFVELYGMSTFVPVDWEDDSCVEMVFENVGRVLGLD
ncbi:GPN3 [Enterospora canceri]|uniref:GPN-loop GTPase 3 n=1 Tax=Enterospora canceri TaxID=1081671 RepID=A0A1Y1S6B3_9MICR|nr:GPN3 [Enterospora canceri]